MANMRDIEQSAMEYQRNILSYERQQRTNGLKYDKIHLSQSVINTRNDVIMLCFYMANLNVQLRYTNKLLYIITILFSTTLLLIIWWISEHW